VGAASQGGTNRASFVYDVKNVCGAASALCYARSDWVSNRILRKRKAWLAADSDCANEQEFRAMFRTRWWQYIGPALMSVILPEEYYQVRVNGNLVFDELGWWHYQRDLQKFDGIESEADRITHSRFLLYCAHGMMLFGNRSQSLQYAMRRIGYEPTKVLPVNPQMWLELESAIDRVRKTVPLEQKEVGTGDVRISLAEDSLSAE